MLLTRNISPARWIAPFALSLTAHGAAAALMATAFFGVMPVRGLIGQGGSSIHLLAEVVGPARPRTLLARPKLVVSDHDGLQTTTQQYPAPIGRDLSPGPVSQDDAALADYAAMIRMRIEANLRYPISLRRRAVSGRVVVGVSFDVRAGALKGLEVREGSGHPELDAIALDAVRAAAPFPPEPSLAKREVVALRLPIDFTLN